MKLDGAQIGNFTEILCSAFTREELTFVLRTKLEFKFDNTVSTAEGFQTAAFQLIDSLDREGRALDLIRVVREARPNEARVVAFCDPLIGQASGSASRPPADMLRKAIAAFNSGFEQRGTLFGYLAAYKQLHDVLHELQSSLPMVDAAVKSRKDVSLPLSPDVVLLLQDQVKIARDSVAETEFPDKPPRWIKKLDDAVKDITGADSAKMLRAAAQLAILPAEGLTPLNEELTKNASRLNVKDLIGSLSDVLTALGSDTTPATTTLRAQVVEFRGLCAELEQLIQAHDLCQRVDYDLHQVKELRPVSTDDPSDWVDAKKTLHDLAEKRPNDEKILRTTDAARLFEAANQDAEFTALVARFNNLFRETDNALLKLTNKLPVKAMKLHTALEKLQ